jgi:hypothetical protein
VDKCGERRTVNIVRKNRAFTLVELLVIVFIIGVLTIMGVVSFNALFSKSDNAEAYARMDRLALTQLSVARDYGYYSPYAKDLTSAGLNIEIVEDGEAVTVADGPAVSVGVSVEGFLGLAALTQDSCLARVIAPLYKGGETTTVELAQESACSAENALTAAGDTSGIVARSSGNSSWND